MIILKKNKIIKNIHFLLLLVFVLFLIISSNFILTSIIFGFYLLTDDMILLFTKSKYETNENRENKKSVNVSKLFFYFIYLIALIFNLDRLITIDRENFMTGIAIIIMFELISNTIKNIAK